MKVLVIGGGAREHAIAAKCAASPLKPDIYLYGAARSIASPFRRFEALNGETGGALAEAIARSGFDLVLIGPESHLAAGLVDELKAADVPAFGPSARGAQLEASKSFAKDVMMAAGIPTAQAQVFSDLDQVRDAALVMVAAQGMAVIKASGLASGKGVFVCFDLKGVEDAVARLAHPAFAEARESILVEQGLRGREVSFFCTLGARGALPIGFSVDFKRLCEGDKGPNTGGMGAYSPVPWLPENAEAIVLEKVVLPLQRELEKRGIDYVGWLYVGLMWGEEGPSVIEFNVRLGDPEAQVLALADPNDWLVTARAQLGLDEPAARISDCRPTVCIVVASSDYPYREGHFESEVISGDLSTDIVDGRGVFFAATAPHGQAGVATQSGRILSVVRSGKDLGEARSKAYTAVEEIVAGLRWVRYRKDIAGRVVSEVGHD